jgi:predicted ATPase
MNDSDLPLRSVERTEHGGGSFPFTVPVIRGLDRIEFTAPVTFFVGENGSGKSTLLEGIAAAAGSITVGAESVERDKTLAHARQLADALRLVWSRRTKKGFFLWAEDFFGYARGMAELRAEMEADIRRIDQEMAGQSEYGRSLAKGAIGGQVGAMRRDYGEGGLDARSHGESFLQLFERRFSGPGLYLLDEPEAPLSPSRQLTLLALIHEMIREGGQFIIATHSPILLAYPGGAILSFDSGQIELTAYDSLEHVQVTRSFLENPAAYLRRLFRE